MGCNISLPDNHQDRESSIETNLQSNIKKYQSIRSLGNFSEDQEIDLEIDSGKIIYKFANELDKKLPLYILFKPEKVIYYKKTRMGKHKKKCPEKKWNYLTDIIKYDNDDETSLIYFSSKSEFYKLKDRFIEEYDTSNCDISSNFLNDNIHVTFHGSEITPYVIYKKLKIKFDFYYIPLSLYNTIKTKIDLMKTVQILELLGASNIWVEFKDKDNKTQEIGANINTGFVDINSNFNSSKSNDNEINQGTSYSKKSGFYFNIDELIEHISNGKHIFMSKEDYEKDFELRYLIRSRIRSFLKTYSRTLHIKKLSSLESKMQLSLNSIYNRIGMNFKYNNERCNESYLIINCNFYGVQELATMDELPLNYEGFKILLEKHETVKNSRKDIIKFVERVMEDQELKQVHVNKTKGVQIDNQYKDIYDNIDSYNDIKNLIKIIRNEVEYTLLNEHGFNVIKEKDDDIYLKEARVFIKRLLKRENIEEEYDNFFKDFESEDQQNDFIRTFDCFSHIQKRVNILLSNPETTAINRKGYTYLKSNGSFNLTKNENNYYDTYDENKNNMRLFFKRFINKHNLNSTYIELFEQLSDNKLNKLFLCYDNIKFIQRNPNHYIKLKEIIDEEEAEKQKIESENLKMFIETNQATQINNKNIIEINSTISENESLSETSKDPTTNNSNDCKVIKNTNL